MKGIDRLRSLLHEARALRLAIRDPRTPWYAKWFLGVAIIYLVSPMDLIPDFIPVLGHLDELVIIPVALWIAIRIVPNEVLEECRALVLGSSRSS